jgi:hypothetical protein
MAKESQRQRQNETQNQMMVLSDEQQKAFDHYQLGENVFITGCAFGV